MEFENFMHPKASCWLKTNDNMHILKQIPYYEYILFLCLIMFYGMFYLIAIVLN